MKRRDSLGHSAVTAAGLTVFGRPELPHGVLSRVAHGHLGKNVAYQTRTPESWTAMDVCGGESPCFTCGTVGDNNNGQPTPSNAVAHGCPEIRHRGMPVIDTVRSR